jgi:hypothetical protein
MTVFGKTAVSAINRLKRNRNLCPLKAWNLALIKYTKSNSMREKCCPKYAFLGICQKIKIKGVNRCTCHQVITCNGQYAIDAIRYLRRNKIPNWSSSPKSLWALFGNLPPSHNNQMDVVIALRNKGIV